MWTSTWLVYTVAMCHSVCVDILLQIHWPQALPKGVAFAFADFKDEHYLGYSEERIADTWKVNMSHVCTQ